MNISPAIIEEAKNILSNPGVILPASIKAGLMTPVYFVGNVDDKSLYTHHTIKYGGKIYKIGTKKS